MTKLKTILVPTDCSPLSGVAVQYAVEFAQKFGGTLHLLYVLDVRAPTVMSDIMTKEIQIAKQELDRKMFQQGVEILGSFWGSVGTPSVDVKQEVVEGTPYLEILRYAKSENTDMIVMGTHGRTGLQHMLIGSVAEKVVRHSLCPVLTVREEGHQFVPI